MTGNQRGIAWKRPLNTPGFPITKPEVWQSVILLRHDRKSHIVATVILILSQTLRLESTCFSLHLWFHSLQVSPAQTGAELENKERSLVCAVSLVRNGNVSLSTTVKFSADIRGLQRISPYDFGDPLKFPLVPPSCQSFHLYCEISQRGWFHIKFCTYSTWLPGILLCPCPNFSSFPNFLKFWLDDW